MKIVHTPGMEISFKKLEVDIPDAVIIDVNHVDETTQQRTNRRGLDIALQHVGSGQPIILTSFETEESLRIDERFGKLVEHANVAFLREPASFDDYRAAYKKAKGL